MELVIETIPTGAFELAHTLCCVTNIHSTALPVLLLSLSQFVFARICIAARSVHRLRTLAREKIYVFSAFRGSYKEIACTYNLFLLYMHSRFYVLLFS